MSFSAVPQYTFNCITDISVAFINQLGIKFLMLDLDNTIAAYDESSPADEIMHWLSEIRNCGVELFIISNSRRKVRVDAFAKTLGITSVNNARKPSPKAVLQAMDTAGFSADNSALAGDQVFTDTLAANRAGIISIIVRPRKCTNLFLSLRYALETPFRAACKNKM